MWRAALAAVLLSGCYASHEVGETTDAAVAADGGMCSLLAPTDVYLEPPLAPGHVDSVTLNGMEADPASLGIRFHLDTCPGAATPCLHDAIVVGIGADVATRIHVPPSISSGFLDWDGIATLHFLVIGGGMCGGCGGELEVLAGSLAPPVAAAVHVSNGPVDCRDECDDYGGIVAESHGTTVAAPQGTTNVVGPVLLRVTQNRIDACRRCHCRAADSPASGLFVSMFGVFGAS